MSCLCRYRINMFQQITIQDIDQEWAWSQLVGRMISVGKKYRYCSPLRGDNSPGVWFEYHNGILLIVDFADRKNSHLNCVTAWSRIKGIHWKKSLREIYDKQGVRVIKKVKEKVKEVEKVISITECWTQEHDEYCVVRGINPTGRVYGVSSYTIVGERTRTWLVNELCFAYKYADGKYKIYFPNRGKDEQRFISNLRGNEVWSKYVDSTLLIGKAHKDFLELLNVWEHSLTHVQSENTWSDLIMDWSVYKEIFILLDNDKTGLNNAYEIAKQIKGKILFIPTVDSLNLVSKLPEDFIKYLPSNLSSIVREFNCNDCPDSIEVATYPLLRLAGIKDFDHLVMSELDQLKIFKWIII